MLLEVLIGGVSTVLGAIVLVLIIMNEAVPQPVGSSKLKGTQCANKEDNNYHG